METDSVTGSLGYLGSVLTGYLERNGFDCVGYDTGFFKDCLLYDPPATKTLIRDARDLEETDLEGISAVVIPRESRTIRLETWMRRRFMIPRAPMPARLRSFANGPE